MEEDERIARSRRFCDGVRLAAGPITALAILQFGDPGRIRVVSYGFRGDRVY
jgi:hypothetical protein